MVRSLFIECTLKMKTAQTSTEHTSEHTVWEPRSVILLAPWQYVDGRNCTGRPSGRPRRHHDSSSKQEAILYAASEYNVIVKIPASQMDALIIIFSLIDGSTHSN